MYSSVRISNYRGLDSFKMRGLGRVNLLVGTNNCGKTSVLECIQLLRSAGNADVLSSILGRRGEWGYSSDEDRRVHLAVENLFADRNLNREVVVEADCFDSAHTSSWNRKVVMCVADFPDDEQQNIRYDDLEEEPQRALLMKWSDAAEEFKARVSSDGRLAWRRDTFSGRNGTNGSVQFIRTSGMTAREVVRVFDDVVLTEKEEHVARALRIIEPAIERLASVRIDQGRFHHEAPGGVVVKMRGAARRIPIGSAGDGMWRMLGLALALANTQGGVLLVDEIDTGLHYSVMADLWRMVGERAAALDVQVFATTHSRDCYESLADIANDESSSPRITIHRIDRDRGRTVRFSNDEIVAAAERGIEVR